MYKIKELYQKVAADNVLLEKFQAILKDAEAAGKKATEEKLIAFAKEAGYDVTIEEVQAFSAQSKGELNDDELDVVAGGKVDLDHPAACVRIFFGHLQAVLKRWKPVGQVKDNGYCLTHLLP